MTSDQESSAQYSPVVEVGVVLAAGRSQRLSHAVDGHSKCLLSLGGIPLVQRAVRALREAGVERVIVVVGYEADAVATSLDGIDVEVVRADRWELGNGASMAAVADLVGGSDLFALMCGDHVFSTGALNELVRLGEPAVLVDDSPDPAAWAEGTRVRVDDGKATEFAKANDDPAIDCGVFVLPTTVFAAYRESAERADHSLAGAVTTLARQVPIRVMPLAVGSWWQDVDTPEDLRSARNCLRRSLGKESDGPVSRRLNRPISTRITMALAPRQVPPKVLSAATLLIGLLAAWFLSIGKGVLGGLLTHVASVLDGSDGETARLRGTASRRGAAVDAFFDRMVDGAIYAGLMLWMWDNPSVELRIAILAASAFGLAALATSLQEPVSIFEIPRRNEPRLIGLLGGRDARMLIIAIGSLAGLPLVALAAALVTYSSRVIWRVGYLVGSRHETAPLPDSIRSSGDRGMRWAATAAVARVVRILLFPVVVIGSFVVVLPQLVDLHEVWSLIQSLSWQAGLLLFALTVWNLVTYWPVVMLSMPGLSLRQAAVVCQSSTSVAMTVPAGGALAVGLSCAMYTSWGFGPAAIAGSTLATFVVGMSVKLLLPVVALAVLVLQGEEVTGLVAAALTGMVAMAAGAALSALVLRGEQTARKLGRAAENLVNMCRRGVGRPPVTGIDDGLAGFRSRLRDLLRDRWGSLSIAAFVSQLSVFLVMLATMHLAGIAQSEVGWAEALAVFASVRLATSVPIVPGNVGIAELGYIGGLILTGGNTTEVVAAVLLFRFLTYFVQIPIGGAAFLAWRREREIAAAEPMTV